MTDYEYGIVFLSKLDVGNCSFSVEYIMNLENVAMLYIVFVITYIEIYMYCIYFNCMIYMYKKARLGLNH